MLTGREALDAQQDYGPPLAASACCEGLPAQLYLEGEKYNSPGVNDTSVSETVLEEAARITSSDRQAAYGPPEENHQRTADLWSAYLGVPITARQVCWLNVLQKASRDVHRPHRDALVDSCGYLRNAERCGE